MRVTPCFRIDSHRCAPGAGASATTAPGLPSSATTAILAKLSPAGTGLPAGVLHTGCTADWNVDGTCVAVASAVRPVQVFNSDGELLDQISTKAQSSTTLASCAWNLLGDTLAVCTFGSSVAVIWNAKSSQQVHFDLGSSAASAVWWSTTSPSQVFIGTATGGVTVLNVRSCDSYKLPSFQSKSKSPVILGACSTVGHIAVAFADKMVAVGLPTGDVGTFKCQLSPVAMKFSAEEEAAPLLAVCLENRGLLVVDWSGVTSPPTVVSPAPLFPQPSQSALTSAAAELYFDESYGRIVSFEWTDLSMLLLGFSNGIISLATVCGDTGKELFHVDTQQDLTSLSYCPEIQVFATCGSGDIRLLSSTDWKELAVISSPERDFSRLHSLQWIGEGDMLSVVSSCGHVYGYSISYPKSIAEGSGDVASPSDSLLSYTIHSFGLAFLIFVYCWSWLGYTPAQLWGLL